MIRPLLGRLLDPRELDRTTTRAVFDTLVDPSSTDPERTALLVALAQRDPSIGELTLAAREMRRRAVPFPIPPGDRAIDLCGSGGAPRPSFNVSTVSAFVVAAAGAPVLKHGNRSARGVCGSSDLLEALGLPVTSSREFAVASYRAERLAFLHAPLYHPATAAVREARRVVGIPTIFNRLGPLVNPARVAVQVVGAESPAAARRFASVLGRLGVRRGVAMSSAEGCDEFSPRRATRAFVWNGPRVRSLTLHPERYLEPGEQRGPWGALPPGEAALAAERLLNGGPGARRGSVLLTSGAALWIAGKSRSIDDGLRTAREALDSGAAVDLLVRLRALARTVRGGSA